MNATPGPHPPGDPARPGPDPSGQGAPSQYPWSQDAPGPYPSGSAAAPGSYPSGSAVAPGPRPAKPTSVRLAVILMWVGAALSLINMLTALALQGEVRALVAAEFTRQGLEATPEMVDASVTAGLVIAGLSGLLGAGLWILNAVFCSRGATWSRILGTVLGGVYLLSAVFTLTQPSPALSKLVVGLTMALALAAIVMLWVKTSNDWFRAVNPRPAPAGFGPPPDPA